jgi:hypothetical protein
VFMRLSGHFSISCSLVPGIYREQGNENRYLYGSPFLPTPSRLIFPCATRARRAFRFCPVFPSTAPSISFSVFGSSVPLRNSRIASPMTSRSAAVFSSPRDRERLSMSNCRTVSGMS